MFGHTLGLITELEVFNLNDTMRKYIDASSAQVGAYLLPELTYYLLI